MKNSMPSQPNTSTDLFVLEGDTLRCPNTRCPKYVKSNPRIETPSVFFPLFFVPHGGIRLEAAGRAAESCLWGSRAALRDALPSTHIPVPHSIGAGAPLCGIPADLGHHKLHLKVTHSAVGRARCYSWRLLCTAGTSFTRAAEKQQGAGASLHGMGPVLTFCCFFLVWITPGMASATAPGGRFPMAAPQPPHRVQEKALFIPI